MGKRGYLLWAKELSQEIRGHLSAIDNRDFQFVLDENPLRNASTKSGLLEIGTIGIALAGYLGAPEKATKALTAIWRAIKKAFQENPRSTSVELDVETTRSGGEKKRIKVVGDDAQAVLILLGALKSQEAGQASLKIILRKG